MIVRMEEARAADGRLPAFTGVVLDTVWPRLQASDGFLGGELYRSYDGEPRLVMITRWRNEGALQAEIGAEWRTAAVLAAATGDLLARPPHVWHFTAVETP